MATTQQHDRVEYTDEQHQTWALLFQRQTALLAGRAHPSYLEGIAEFGLTEAIPDLDELNDRLAELVGWTVATVDGQVTGEVFCGLLDDRKIPSTTYVRGLAEIEHSKEPDMFHDIFGHLPLLREPSYREFLQAFGRASLDLLPDEQACRLLGRAFKWTVEYGLIGDGNGLRAYGAGLMSSSGELQHVLGDNVVRLPFEPAVAIGTAHVPASLQPQYFVIESFAQLTAQLPEMVRSARSSSTAR